MAPAINLAFVNLYLSNSNLRFHHFDISARTSPSIFTSIHIGTDRPVKRQLLDTRKMVLPCVDILRWVIPNERLILVVAPVAPSSQLLTHRSAVSDDQLRSRDSGDSAYADKTFVVGGEAEAAGLTICNVIVVVFLVEVDIVATAFHIEEKQTCVWWSAGGLGHGVSVHVREGVESDG
jgi:hypothetical protein